MIRDRTARSTERGSAMVEAAIVFPVLVVIVMWSAAIADIMVLKLKAAEAARYALFETTVLHTGPQIDADVQARYLEAAAFGILFTSIYLPNGNPQPGPKFAYKLAWFERLVAHAADLAAAGHPVVLAGDYNIVPTELDIYASRSWIDNALLQPAPREAYRRLLAQGWSDALRELHPDQRLYTFWDRLRNGWPRDAGLRIDHLLVSASLRSRLVAAGVDREMRGRENASDHAPAWIELSDAPAPKRRRAPIPTTSR